MKHGSKPGPGYYLAFILIGPLTYLAHEFGHWAGGEAVGVDMWMSLNKAGPVASSVPGEFEALIIAASGPVVTLIIAILAYIMAATRRSFFRLWHPLFPVHVPTGSGRHHAGWQSSK